MNELTIKLMTDREARECVAKINANLTDIRHLVLELYEREGWTAMGYASWRECVTAEFNQNERYLYRQLEAAQTAKQICPLGQKEEIPERQLRPLTKLRDNPEAQKEAWQRAVETAPEGKVTAAHVASVVKEMTGAGETTRIVHQPIIKQEMIAPEFQAAFDQMVIELKNARAMKWKTTSHKGAIEMMQILLNIAEQ
jgi:hypothetical protein